MGKKVKIVLDMQAHFEEKITFFGSTVNKVPCIIRAIWGKINFLEIFGVKTHWIIGQNSQNCARYAGAFWRKNHFFGRKVNKVPCIIGAIWGKINFLGRFPSKCAYEIEHFFRFFWKYRLPPWESISLISQRWLNPFEYRLPLLSMKKIRRWRHLSRIELSPKYYILSWETIIDQWRKDFVQSSHQYNFHCKVFLRLSLIKILKTL